MLKKILLLLTVSLLLLTMPVLAADDAPSENDNSNAGYSQSDECQGGACSWKR
ncbi:hypothetical protein [Anaerovibrio lipolyticus]|uniref:hypothetical protein n=1 Tax=Anaerovibrio lipolyticus TaxID=82374 RepID=UPI0013564BE8|nr:hypothetical protein [Anaerovibrio lipolyticus]